VTECPTLLVVRKEDDVQCVINVSDFDPAVYTAVGTSEKTSPAPKTDEPKKETKRQREAREKREAKAAEKAAGEAGDDDE